MSFLSPIIVKPTPQSTECWQDRRPRSTPQGRGCGHALRHRDRDRIPAMPLGRFECRHGMRVSRVRTWPLRNVQSADRIGEGCTTGALRGRRKVWRSCTARAAITCSQCACNGLATVDWGISSPHANDATGCHGADVLICGTNHQEVRGLGYRRARYLGDKPVNRDGVNCRVFGRSASRGTGRARGCSDRERYRDAVREQREHRGTYGSVRSTGYQERSGIGARRSGRIPPKLRRRHRIP